MRILGIALLVLTACARSPAQREPSSATALVSAGLLFPGTTVERVAMDVGSPQSAVAQILGPDGNRCTGTLLATPGSRRRVVLTAAHCVTGLASERYPENGRMLRARFPVLTDFPRLEHTFNVVAITEGAGVGFTRVGPSMMLTDVPRDFALLLLESPVPTGVVTELPLAISSANFLPTRVPTARVETFGLPENNCQGWPAFTFVRGTQCELLGKRSNEQGGYLLTSCFLNRGSSGGPLIGYNADGAAAVIGVMSVQGDVRGGDACHPQVGDPAMINVVVDVTGQGRTYQGTRRRSTRTLLHELARELVRSGPATP